MNELIYDGKAKEILKAPNEGEIYMYYKDDEKAYNGIKKAKIQNKGIINNKISALIFEYLNSQGIRTHFISLVDDRRQLCEQVKIIPIECVCRNVACGSLCARFNLEEGQVFDNEIVEYSLKNDELDDPFINFDHAMALKIASKETLKKIDRTVRGINKLLIKFFDDIDIILVDFKTEFGFNKDGELLLADEISPDTARLWDKKSKMKLDKDRFRRDLGKIEEAYTEILKRLKK